MQNQIQTFSFNNEALQVINKDGNAWFVASEIAALFGYRDAANLTRLLDEDEADTHIMSIRSENGVIQNRTVSIINESGFYHAAFKSRKPEVKPFRRWVTNEILPTIRKTGSYSVSNQPAPTHRINEEQYARLVALCVAWSNANPDNGGMTRSHTGVGKALRQMERAAGKSLAEFDIGDYAAALDGMADKILSFRHINARHPFQKMSKGDLAQTLAAITELLPALPSCKSRAAALPPPALKYKDGSIGSLLLGYGSGNPDNVYAELALQDMAEIQSVFTRMTYAASAENQLSKNDLEEIKSANDSLNFLSFMVMEAAAEALKH